MQRICQFVLKSERYVQASVTQTSARRTKFSLKQVPASPVAAASLDKKQVLTKSSPLFHSSADLTTTASKPALTTNSNNFCEKSSKNSSDLPVPDPFDTLFDALETRRVKKSQKKPKRHFSTPNLNLDMDTERDFKRLEAKLSNLRQWEHTPAHEQYLKSQQGVPFTLCSYNILAQNLLEAHPYLYQNHDSRALPWNQRNERLIQEILTINPQILCLQEMQESHLAMFEQQLSSLDLSVLYKKRTGFKDDGCAIFYNHKLFNLIEYHTIEYYQPNCQLLNRENVALVAKLSPKSDPNCTFVVATTHLLYNPRRQDVRLAQVQVLLAELDRIAFSQDSKYVPVILTGDFNLQPYSAPYKLLTRGQLRYDQLMSRTLEKPRNNEQHYDCTGKQLLPKNLGITDDCQHLHVVTTNERNYTKLHHTEKIFSVDDMDSNAVVDLTQDVPFSTGELRHKFNFNSVYEHKLGQADQEASTFQDQWITVDYIFYSNETSNRQDETLKLLGRYKLPSVDRCADMGMVPNLYFGSDHLSLAAKFLIKGDDKAKL
ncbi:protein angel [Culicoides brevitarsis]|uniref:protein angel n=1 Tax=Culicoides brevitarsis TaxID=469753 RepID=UPI00307C4970